MNMWSELPAADWIDMIIDSVSKNPVAWNLHDIFTDDFRGTIASVEGGAINLAAYDIWKSTWGPIWRSLQIQSPRGQTATTPYSASYAASCGAILIMILYPECAYMLQADVDEIRILAKLGDTKAIILLPACIALHAVDNNIAIPYNTNSINT